MSRIQEAEHERTKGRSKPAALMRSITGLNGSPRLSRFPTPVKMPQIRPPKFPDRTVDIRRHGAVGDGGTDCTSAIAKAIAACAEAGGGRVLVPAGVWLTGPIHLRSNIDLHLERGATVRFYSDPERYLPPVFVRWAGQECYNYSPLIYARNGRNIAITGRGVLLGQGQPWWCWEKAEQQACARLYQMVLQGVPVEQRRFGSPQHPLRPQFVLLIDCENLLLEDFTVGEGGPFWTVHTAYCRNVVIRRLNIIAPDGPNNDGIDIDSSRDVLIEECNLHTRDDCIALKSGLNEDGWRVGKPTENVIVRRIRATGGRGGITIGSEMSGGVRNVFVHDCHYDGLDSGILIKAARERGGVVENVAIQDITMGCIAGDAIHLTAQYALTTQFSSVNSPDGRSPTLRNIQIRHVTCQHASTAVRMTGLPNVRLQDIHLENVAITADQGLLCTAGQRIQLVDVKIMPRSGPVLSLKDSQEVSIHGLNNAQSARVFLDLRGRQTRHIRLCGEARERVRPAVVLGVDVPRDALVHE